MVLSLTADSCVGRSTQTAETPHYLCSASPDMNAAARLSSEAYLNRPSFVRRG